MTPSEPWGWKVTIHVYGTGPKPGSDQMFAAADHAAALVGAEEFADVDMKVVQKPPRDQGARP